MLRLLAHRATLGRRRKGMDDFIVMVLFVALGFMFITVYFASASGWLEQIVGDGMDLTSQTDQYAE